jgi:hypothetical protein
MKNSIAKIYSLIFICFTLFQIPLNLIAGGDKPAQGGFERTERKGDAWKWGTAGHGSFDTAVQLFGASADVSTYTTPQATYRVFTRGELNFVEMVCSWGGGVLTYTTPVNANAASNKATTTVESADSKAGSQKIDRAKAPWEWGTFNLGSFDITAAILGAEGDVISFKQDGRAKYRVFTHGTLNFVEVDYGWPGGVFKYTTRNPKTK